MPTRPPAGAAPFDAGTAPQTLADLIGWIADRFDAAELYFGHGTDNALDEAAWLACHVLELTPEALDDRLEDTLAPAARARMLDITRRRIESHKPLAYLINEAWFAGRRYYVDERVIVPRSHLGEFVLEQFQPWIDPSRVRRVLDVCTGSGCIALAAAHAFPNATVVGTDISAEALAVAARNVEQHALAARVTLHRADCYDGAPSARYDVILSNPPYVHPDEIATLPEEYRHEPPLALVSGDDGLALVRRLLAGAAARLAPHGILLVETGNSAEALQAAFPSVPFTWLTTSTGDESVFLLTAEQLAQHQILFDRACG